MKLNKTGFHNNKTHKPEILLFLIKISNEISLSRHRCCLLWVLFIAYNHSAGFLCERAAQLYSNIFPPHDSVGFLLPGNSGLMRHVCSTPLDKKPLLTS